MMNQTSRSRLWWGVGALALLGGAPAWGNSPPVISNLTASQRTDGSMKVDIRYDLTDADGDACMVTVEGSNDGGQTWAVPVSALTGDVGPGVTPGLGKLIVWNCGSDLPGWTGTLDLRVTAAEGGPIVGWGSQVVGGDLSSGFVAVAGGGYHSLGLKADGSIVAWGGNLGSQSSVPSPNSGFVAVAGGGVHSLGLKADGSIIAWGYNTYGECDVPSPNSGFVAVAGGWKLSLGLKADASIVAWGRNDEGQCNVPSPNSGFVAVAAGLYHSLGLKDDGSIKAWGKSLFGQCNVPSPNSGFVAVAGGEYHSLGLKADGSVVAWGVNGDGQCNVPWPNSGFVAVTSGGYHSLGLKADGSIVSWGWNHYGQCDVPSPNNSFVAVAAGAVHSLGLKADGSVMAWGQTDNRCNVPSPNSGFMAVAGGWSHSLGLKAGGVSTAVTQIAIDNVPPRLTGAVSRRTHGSGPIQQNLDINLPLDPPESAAVECRAGGLTKLMLTFTEAIQAADGSIDPDQEVTTQVNGSPLTGLVTGLVVSGNELAVDLASVPDESCLTITLHGIIDAVGNPLVGDNDVHVCVLAGDVTADRVVNLQDLSAIKSQLFDPLTEANFRTDVYPDAVINIVDLQTVKGSSTSPGLLFHTTTCP